MASTLIVIVIKSTIFVMFNFCVNYIYDERTSNRGGPFFMSIL